MTRNEEYYVIMTVIYDELMDFLAGNGDAFRDARELMSEISEMPYEEVSPFVKQCVTKTLQNYGNIVNAFLPYLKNWKWERIPHLSQAILLMSYARYYYVEKIDKKIVINTAVNLAKKYVEEKQAKFINAILDGVLSNAN